MIYARFRRLFTVFNQDKSRAKLNEWNRTRKRTRNEDVRSLKEISPGPLGRVGAAEVKYIPDFHFKKARAAAGRANPGAGLAASHFDGCVKRAFCRGLSELCTARCEYPLRDGFV